MSQAPLVSVIVPHYNHAAYLRQRMESILSQTYKNIEVLLLDDASTDEGRSMIRHYESSYPEVQAFMNSENSGNPFHQWKKGIERSNGAFIWIAESDDFASSTLISCLLNPLLDDPSLGISYCGTSRVCENGTPLEEGTWMEKNSNLRARWQSNFKNSGREECRHYLIRGNTLPNASAVLFRKEAYESSGGLDLTYRYAGDWLLWSKILSVSDIAFHAERLNFQRVHKKSVTQRSFLDPAHFLEYHRVRQYILNNFDVSEELKKLCVTEYTEDLLSHLVASRMSPFAALNIIFNAFRRRRQVPSFEVTKIIKGVADRLRKKLP